ncbi:MAG: 4Fe-4S binding protein [Sedimentisphaerales bacterium]
MIKESSSFKTVLLVVLLITLVISGSLFFTHVWAGKPANQSGSDGLVIENGMTVLEFGQANNLPNPALREIFNLQQRSDLQKRLSEYGTRDQIVSMVTGKSGAALEYESKNWKKIAVKFLLWFAFLTAVFLSFNKRKITHKTRNWILLAAVVIFGVIMGSDPGPMGTVKDAIALYGKSRQIFPPRLIAMTVFLLMVFVVNKYICGWGCQAGTLQDLIFRLNQNDKGNPVIGKQIKIPFAITNTVRFMTLAALASVAVLWGFDIIEPVDPFKMFKPSALGIVGGIFAGILFLGSLFVYFLSVRACRLDCRKNKPRKNQRKL